MDDGFLGVGVSSSSRVGHASDVVCLYIRFGRFDADCSLQGVRFDCRFSREENLVVNGLEDWGRRDRYILSELHGNNALER